VVEKDEREAFHVPGPRWFSRGLRVCDSEGTEVARLRPVGRWWLPAVGYKLFRGEVEVARLRPWGLVSAEGVSTSIRGRFFGGDFKFIQGSRIVARLTSKRRFLRPTTSYDLEVAQDIDPVLVVAVCVGIDQMNRMVFTGGG
jgi:hypothetical protein